MRHLATEALRLAWHPRRVHRGDLDTEELLDGAPDLDLRRVLGDSEGELVEEIEASLPQIASAGFGAIQISPPQLSNGGPWWGRYQPLDYRIIDGPLGNETQLRNMVAAADALGIDVIADVVLNHMANMGSNFDLSYPPQEFRSKYKIGGLFSRNDFKSPYCISNWNDPQHVIDGRLCGGDGDSGLPDLVLMSDYVIGVHQTYLRKLKDIGIKGFRVDAVKHMEKEYFPRVFTDEITEGVFVFGEVIATAGTFDRDLEPYLRATDMAFMDFPLQATIKDAFGPSGSLSNLIGAVNRKGALSWDRAVTFVVNHDIPNNEGFRSQILDPIDETLAYTYILGRSYGVPHIYSAKGKADGLRDDRWKFAHLDSSLKRKNFFHNVVHGTGQTVIHSSNCALVISRGDKAFFTINKCGEDLDLSQNLGLNAGTYRELLADQTIEMSSGEQKLTIPARSRQMFLHTDLLK